MKLKDVQGGRRVVVSCRVLKETKDWLVANNVSVSKLIEAAVEELKSQQE